MNLAELYTEQVHKNLKPLYGVWEPTMPVKLGDYGVLHNNIFIKLGELNQLNIQFEKEDNQSDDQKMFSSAGSVEINTYGKGATTINGVANAKVALEIKFSNEKAVFFNAAGCGYSMIKDKVSLGKEIMRLFEEKKWKYEWAIVTDAIRAKSTTIAISSGTSGNLLLEASGDVEQIELADATAGLVIKTASNIGYQIVSKEGITPLVGFCKIQTKFFFWNEFKPYLTDNPFLQHFDRLSAPDEGVASSEELYFGQLK